MLDILDPKSVLKRDADVLTYQLSDFSTKNALLTDPALKSIIDDSGNAESIYAAVNNNTTTIGNLLSLLTAEQ